MTILYQDFDSKGHGHEDTIDDLDNLIKAQLKTSCCDGLCEGSAMTSPAEILPPEAEKDQMSVFSTWTISPVSWFNRIFVIFFFREIEIWKFHEFFGPNFIFLICCAEASKIHSVKENRKRSNLGIFELNKLLFIETF